MKSTKNFTSHLRKGYKQKHKCGKNITQWKQFFGKSRNGYINTTQ